MATRSVIFTVAGTRETMPPVQKSDTLFFKMANMIDRLRSHNYQFGEESASSASISRQSLSVPAVYGISIRVGYADGGVPFPAADRPERMLEDFRADLESSLWKVTRAEVKEID